MTRTARWLLPGVLALLVGAATGAWGQADRVTLYTPPFLGPGALGQSVATIFNLQLWETLRAAPSPNPKGLSFGLGVIVWGRPLDRYGHEAAEDRAKEIALLAQFVFWGKVYEYGDGAVAQTNLSIPRYWDFRQQHPETWELRFHLFDGDLRFEADIPQRRYSFRPIVLAKEIVSRYSQPNALQIHQRQNGGAVIGSVGNEFTRLRQDEDMAEVTSGGKRGWVHLPELSRRSEVVDFVGGIVRVFRGDWQGAEELMNRVAGNTEAPNELRTDAYLYAGLAQYKQGKQSGDSFAAARALSPNARRCIVYSTMGELAEFARLRDSRANRLERQIPLTRAKRFLSDNRPLFPASDSWVEDVSRGIEELAREP